MEISNRPLLSIFVLSLLVFSLVIPASAEGLIRMNLKKIPLDENMRVAARISNNKYESFKTDISDGSDSSDIISLKNYLNAQYFGEIGIDCLPVPLEVSVREIKHLQEKCDKKIKRPRAKTRKSAQGNATEVLGSSTNAAENGPAKRTKKRKSRECQQETQKTVTNDDLPDKSRDDIMKIPDENRITTFNTEWKFKKARTYKRRRKTPNQPDISNAKSNQTLEIMAACNPVDHLSFVPGENDNVGISRVSR